MSQVERTTRLFFALWPDEGMQAALADAFLAALGGAGEELEGRRVPEKSFHLTLAFLGGVPESRFEALHDVADACARGHSMGGVPLDVTLDTLEHWRVPQILCATASEAPVQAIGLAEALKNALVKKSFSPDLKPFRAHATVARKVRRVTRELHIEPVRWSFDSLHLVESPSDGTYSTVEKWVLDKWD